MTSDEIKMNSALILDNDLTFMLSSAAIKRYCRNPAITPTVELMYREKMREIESAGQLHEAERFAATAREAIVEMLAAPFFPNPTEKDADLVLRVMCHTLGVASLMMATGDLVFSVEVK
jgi:hypothetical protein